jgi:hypothetical protein
MTYFIKDIFTSLSLPSIKNIKLFKNIKSTYQLSVNIVIKNTSLIRLEVTTYEYIMRMKIRKKIKVS